VYGSLVDMLNKLRQCGLVLPDHIHTVRRAHRLADGNASLPALSMPRACTCMWHTTHRGDSDGVLCGDLAG